MTDLERAQEVFDAMCEDPEIWATHGMPQDTKEARIVRCFADALAAARREGAEEMRENQLGSVPLIEDIIPIALRAALPAEPTPEAMSAMREAYWTEAGADYLHSLYRALRAHLLGEDA